MVFTAACPMFMFTVSMTLMVARARLSLTQLTGKELSNSFLCTPLREHSRLDPILIEKRHSPAPHTATNKGLRAKSVDIFRDLARFVMLQVGV